MNTFATKLFYQLLATLAACFNTLIAVGTQDYASLPALTGVPSTQAFSLEEEEEEDEDEDEDDDWEDEDFDDEDDDYDDEDEDEEAEF
jgi:hypothetical protein